MTVFGKILTFIVLVLALAQAALHVMFHIQQVKYEVANKKFEESNQASQAMIDSQAKALAEQKTQADAALTALADQKKAAEGNVATLQAKIDTMKVEYDLLNNRANDTLAMQAKNNVDVQSRERDNVLLAKAVESRDTKIKEMIQTVNEFRQAKVKAEIAANSLQLRNDQLIEKFKELEVELARRSSAGSGVAGAVPGGAGATGGATAATAKSPPSANVEGLITRTDPQSGMVTVSVGTDAGVAKGNTLEVFRLNPPKYLGTIRILEAKPNEAVGKPINKPMGQINQGDHVAAKILGS